MNTPAKIKTFLKQINSGKLTKDREKVFHYIRNNPGVIEREVSTALNIPLQTVSARCSGLKDLGLLYSLSQKKTNNSTHEVLYAEVDLLKIAQNQRKRKKIKFKNWLKKSSDFKDFLSPDLLAHIETSKVYGINAS